MSPITRATACLLAACALAAAPAPQPPAAAPRAGRGNPLPAASPEQSAALARITTDLAPLTQSLTAARTDLYKSTFDAPTEATLKTKVAAIRTAELTLANARAAAFAALQSSPNKFTRQQLPLLTTDRGAARGTLNSGGANIPHVTSNQIAQLTQLTGALQKPTATLAAARAVLADPFNDAPLTATLDTLAAAELSLATTRTTLLAKLQSSPDKLAPDQLTALIAMGGIISSGNFNEPQPLDFNDHEGYVSLFDGKSLKGWDGNPKFWRVEDGAIIGESTPQNPSGNSYLAYRDLEAHDFTLKFEIKVDGAGGSGIQYRSKTGIPWLTPVPANVANNVGPINLNWMMTGPQADFWPSRDTTAQYTGQFYSENTPMRIMAWRGQVVEGAGMAPRRLMATIGDRMELGKLVKRDDWNQYTVIARGPTFLHIVNGQLMSAMIDDDPASSNNQSGLIGIEIEATTKLYVKNIWLKKLN